MNGRLSIVDCRFPIVRQERELAIGNWKSEMYLWRRARRGSSRILAVEFSDESAGNVDAVCDVQQRHLAGVYDDVDAARFGEGFEGSANFILQRREKLLAALVVSSLRVFAFALDVFLQLFELIDLGLQRTLVDWRAFRCALQLLDFGLECLPARLHSLDLIFLSFKLAVEFVHQDTESRNACFGIQECVGVDDGHSAVGHIDDGRRSGRGWWCWLSSSWSGRLLLRADRCGKGHDEQRANRKEVISHHGIWAVTRFGR